MGPLNLLMIGTAGAGKSSLTATFGRWLVETSGMRVAMVNLDPGCESLPFKPDFDIRNHFTIERIMREENLGPNGAMVRASEMMERGADEFARYINGLNDDMRLIDTPGQMEVFLFHGGPTMVNVMNGTTIAFFLIDAEVAKTASGLILTRLLGLSTGLRLGVPTIGVLNKIDLVRESLPDIERTLSDEKLLKKRLVEEGSGVMVDLMLRLAEVLPLILPAARIAKTSAKTGEGVQELYDIAHEVLCACGDLT